MNKKKSMTGLFLIIAVLFIGIGYAAISSVTLNIVGNAKVDPASSAFDVQYKYDSNPSNNILNGTGGSGYSATAGVTKATYVDGYNATIDAPEFTLKDQYVDFTLTVVNKSTELMATITTANITLPSGNTYFSVTLPETVNLNLAPNAEGTFKVRVTCLKTPTATQTWDGWTVTINAQPAEAS